MLILFVSMPTLKSMFSSTEPEIVEQQPELVEKETRAVLSVGPL